MFEDEKKSVFLKEFLFLPRICFRKFSLSFSVEFLFRVESINSHEPIFRGENFFEKLQIELFLADLGLSNDIKTEKKKRKAFRQLRIERKTLIFSPRRKQRIHRLFAVSEKRQFVKQTIEEFLRTFCVDANFVFEKKIFFSDFLRKNV